MSETNKVHGYVITRKPGFPNLAEGAVPAPAPIDGKYYQGPGNLTWVDAMEDRFSGRSSELSKRLYNTLNEQQSVAAAYDTVDRWLLDLALCREVHRAFHPEKNQILGLLALDVEGFATTDLTPGAVHLGFDVIQFHGWSLLEDGIFWKPSLFAAFTDKLNAFGLFNSPEVLDPLTELYNELSKDNLVDPLVNWPEVPVLAVSVWKIDA